MRRILQTWPATSVFVVSMLITYVAGIPIALALGPVEASLGLRPELLSLWVMRWGPTIAGFLVLAAVAGRRGFAIWLAQLLRWRVGLRYYAFVYAAALGLFIASVVLAFAPEFPVAAERPSWGTLAGSYLQEIVYTTLTNGEEAGWRFVLLGLLLTRMNLLSAALVSGVAWVLWHLPMYLWLGGGGLTMFAPFVFVGLGLSIILAWLYKATDSLLLPILFHGAVNATTYAFERNFPSLAGELERLGALGEWAYAAALLPVVVFILAKRRKLFFGPVHPRHGEDWVGPPSAVGVRR